jgi:hypothetical protein
MAAIKLARILLKKPRFGGVFCGPAKVRSWPMLLKKAVPDAGVFLFAF